ncbi:DUF4178 domain-containing protein [Paenibacillus apiarius]|uniref:DUF4178 domain-containing protein n=1 Tax=Paenibacillus apiarius TaxID=46240 RepID=A0ABT4DU51_9BACL|nr:DUF4178 domain-containing protein [Paenibacillus apiarius]MCY9515977.1 DUF4178 domain-containing protein [Paenibacillus apiarius]MCY9520887.1 DUF4178 domain-containing protein [Paenibacillus apiarius]MCY9553592.1 DUF4178 domain-containing protein [Paenibacillus apiarius]MCY9557885.1 DUF4178 domain-containing protein [Paenibacillus apiarius]MCY9685740.1 DUF4178 domain-containing protein [Paenibacillus apiarius]
MSLWQRLKNIMAKPEPPKPEKTSSELGPGDICEVSLVSYEVTGRTDWRTRNAAWLTMRDGAQIKYLLVEQREQPIYSLYEAIDGRLDGVEEVPSEVELDGRWFYLEDQYNGRVVCSGQTPFGVAGEQYVWQYQSDDRKLLRIEWQDGRFQLYEGDTIISADVRILRRT